MKKLYTILLLLNACMLFTFPLCSLAQSKSTGETAIPFTNSAIGQGVRPGGSSAQSGAFSSAWLGYWFVADSLALENNNFPAHYYAFMFPDSSVTVCEDANTCFNPSVHLIGNVLDPNAAEMQRILDYTWDNAGTYYIDSVEIYYDYIRTGGAPDDDSLLLYLWNNVVPKDIDKSWYFTGAVAANYNIDTMRIAFIPYDSTGTNKPKPSNGALKNFSIPLSDADTAQIGSLRARKVINTNHFAVPAGKLVASAVGFKPGYSYSPGDILTAEKNAFAILSTESNGENTFGTYTTGDWNQSYMVNNTNRYHMSTTGYNKYFIPTYAFLGDSYHLEHHYISYYVTWGIDGVNEAASNDLKLFQNSPNPASNSTLIRYETTSAGRVSLEIRDITGRIIEVMNQGVQSSGRHALSIDISDFAKGMYLYTLRVNDNALTNRMIVY